MFILRVVDRYDEYNFSIGYSEDEAKLQAMIKQFESATNSPDNKLLAFEDCPEIIEFGNILLKKDDDAICRCYQGHNSSKLRFAILYGDILEIEEVCAI